MGRRKKEELNTDKNSKLKGVPFNDKSYERMINNIKLAERAGTHPVEVFFKMLVIEKSGDFKPKKKGSKAFQILEEAYTCLGKDKAELYDPKVINSKGELERSREANVLLENYKVRKPKLIIYYKQLINKNMS